ncbi:MAG: M56 family metallopeptidase [FCB group bacterium]|jgi:beta-lactamase regulating signal transducer with metallopeptidase domain|nr:M56 family metallopeptidase [FCB group bacterium]
MLWWLAQNALGATVLAGAVALLTRFVRLRPAVAHVLWLLVILKLLAPPLLVLPWPSAPPAAATPIAETSSDTPRLVLRNTSAVPAEAPASGISAPAVPDKSLYERWLAWARTAVTRESLQSLITRTWLVGALAMAVLQLAWLVRLRLGLRKGLAPPSWLVDELQNLAEQLGVSPPRAVVRSTGSPLLVGGIRPTLVLPVSLLEQLDTSGWKSVLAHELIHLKRRDHWTGWLELAAACLWWWNPVFWYARRRLRESAEYACDAWVVRLLPENRRAYAESLITVVASLTRHPLPVASIGMAAHGRRIFERRLEMILREAVPHRLSRLAVTGAALAALLMLPGWALPTASPPPLPVAKLQSAKESAKPVKTPSDHPKAPNQESAKKTPELPDPGAPVDSRPSPKQLAELQDVSVGAGLQVRPPDPSKDAKPEEAKDKPKAGAIDLDRRVSIEFKNQHISGIVDYLVEYCGINVVMDPRVIAPKAAAQRSGPPVPGVPAPPVAPVAAPAPPGATYATDGMVEHILVEDMALGEVFTTLLTPLKLEYRVIGHVIFISTPENLGKAKPEAPQFEPGQEALAKKLNANASMEFEIQELHGLLDYARSYFDVDCRIDPEAKLPGTGLPAAQGIVFYIRLEDLPLWEALYWITLPLDLTYTVKDDTVWITTPDRTANLPVDGLSTEKAPEELGAPQPAQSQNVTADGGLQSQANGKNEPKPIDLERECSIHFQEQHLASIVDYLTEYYSYNFVMDPRVIAPNPKLVQADAKNPPDSPSRDYVSDGMVGYVKLEKVSLGKTLEAMLRPMKLDYRVAGNIIFISTPENLAKAEPKAPALGADQETLAKKLNAEVALEFENEQLAKILDYLRDHVEINAEIDPGAKLPGTGRAATEAVVTQIRLERVPMWEALYWLTLTSDLTYTVKGETVWVTTADRAAEVGK